ncbi:c-type cytochrome [bacterium]|jgi:cbb3-type cytochrome c oxidase subunit III|nr:c-type cytochrome [bacterium]
MKKSLEICITLAFLYLSTSQVLSSPGTEDWKLLGKAIFKTHCAVCHQEDGNGKIGFAPSIRNQDFLAIASDEFIRRTIIEGRPGTSMTPRPDFKGLIADSIILYLRSLPVKNSVSIDLDQHWKAKGNAIHGKGLFRNFCSSCHGANGEGYNAGVPGTAIGLSGFLSQASDDYIFQTIKRGRVGTAMKPMMGKRGVANLSNQQVEDIIVYLRSKSPREMLVQTADYKEVSKHGKILFDANCAVCHQSGGVGKVGFAPSIRNRDFLAIASDDFIKKTIKNGRPGTSMPPRPDLPERDINAIISYLRDIPVKVPVHYNVDPRYEAEGDIKSGKFNFERYCQYCHGTNGIGYTAGGSGPGIGLAGFLDSASDDYIFKTIQQGRVGTAMRSFMGVSGVANLSGQDVNDIIVYLRNLNQ